MKKHPASGLARPMDLPSNLTTLLVEKINGLRSSVKTDYLKSEIDSKFVSKDTDPAADRRARAIFKWLCTERENEATNERLLITHEEYNILPRVAFGKFVEWCRDLTRDIIGDTAPIEALIGSFSGGASTSRNRTQSHPASKYLGKAHVTLSCLPVFESIVDEMPGWISEMIEDDFELEIVPGNVLFTVPKKTDIDRCACKEPDLNMFIQKGIGSYFRGCLLNTGINLNDQSINRSLAREGSLTNNLSTLDLSSASDSVSEGLVALFLPECWFTLLDSVRSRVTIIDGEEHRNQMFSSMGNGFTFELESLLFYVLARATAYFTNTPGRISVYGDDIICPRAMSHDLETVLSYMGFSVNSEKSCFEGPFRESCGGHYYVGLDVTPFYIKEPITTLPGLIHVANQLREWAEIEGTSVLDPEVEAIWQWLKSHIPSCLWGGEDTSFKYQLVSYDTPSQRLANETKRKSTGFGGYLHWLNATWKRTQLSDGVQTSSKVESSERLRYRSVRNTTVPRLKSLFLHEIGVTPE